MAETYRSGRSNGIKTLLISTAQNTRVFRIILAIPANSGVFWRQTCSWLVQDEWFFFFFEYFWYLHILSLECWMTMIVQISACRIIPHFFFLLSIDQTVQVDYPFSSCFHFNEQLPVFSTSLKDRVPFFKKMRQVFIFRSKGWTYWDMHLNRAYFFCFSSRHQMDHVHLLCTIKVLTLHVVQSLLWRFIYINIYIYFFF